jgi:hypothetical protein
MAKVGRRPIYRLFAGWCSARWQGPPFSVTQLTSYFNPSQTADPRTRGSVPRANRFVQIAIAHIDQRSSENTNSARYTILVEGL